MAKRAMEEAESQGYWSSFERVCAGHIASVELATFMTQFDVDDPGADACAVCGAADEGQVELDELRGLVASLVRTYWSPALDHLYPTTSPTRGSPW